MDGPSAASRLAYPHVEPLQSRWIDNDVYGHINNATYYHFFDTVANGYLIREGGLDFHRDPVIAFIVASSCNYRYPLAYPAEILAGFRVDRLGRSSVQYGIALFAVDRDDAAAHGTFTHVFVDRETQRAVPIPETIRRALDAVRVES